MTLWLFRCKAARIVSPRRTRFGSLIVWPRFEPGIFRIQAKQRVLQHDATPIAEGLIIGAMIYCHVTSVMSACLLDSLPAFLRSAYCRLPPQPLTSHFAPGHCFPTWQFPDIISPLTYLIKGSHVAGWQIAHVWFEFPHGELNNKNQRVH